MFKLFSFVLTVICLWSSLLLGQEVPAINDDPLATNTLNTEMFDWISGILSSGKMAPHMLCTLKVRNERTLRKFSDGEKWMEILNISFNSNGFDSGYKMNFKIPISAKYGIKKSTNQWSGIGEEIKIELGDHYDHYIKFTHDGHGQIVQLILGNNLRTVPCQLKN
ncbi:MAG: hypothetical protein ACXWRZ_19490 [Bdellovibrio sp.]